MNLGLCKRCGKLTTQSCKVCGVPICIGCSEPYGCKICMGRKEMRKG